MSALIEWLSTNALIVGGLFPFVALAARGLRHRPAAAHMLWFLLLVKLVLPPVVHWPWSLTEAAQTWIAPSPSTSDSNAAVEMHDSTDTEWLLGAEEPAGVSFDAEQAATHENLAAGETTRNPAWDALTLVGFAWLTGAAIAVTATAIGLARQRRLMRKCLPPSSELVAAIERIAARVGVRPPRAEISPDLSGPVVCCLGSPRLLWPARLASPTDISEGESVLAHELAHVFRRDHRMVYVELIATVACWWNPFLWIIRRRLEETRESACDALALAATGQRRGDYAQKILNFSMVRADQALCAPAFGAGTVSRRMLKRRLTMVFEDRVHGRVSAAGVLLAASFMLVGLPGVALVRAEGETGEETLDKSGKTVREVVDVTESSDDVLRKKIKTIVIEDELDEDASDADATPTKKTSSDARPRRVIKTLKPWQWTRTLDKSALEEGGTVEVPLPHNLGVLRINNNEQGNLTVLVEGASPEGEYIVQHYIRKVDSTGSSDAQPGRYAPQPKQFTREHLGSKPAPYSKVPDDRAWDLETIQLDVELAQLTIDEKRSELDSLAAAAEAAPGSVPESQLRLAKLAVARAEIELRRAQIQLKRTAPTSPMKRDN